MATKLMLMTLAEIGLPGGATAQEIAERLRELGIQFLLLLFANLRANLLEVLMSSALGG